MTTTITHKRALKSIFVVALLVVSLFGVSTKAFAANSYNGTITNYIYILENSCDINNRF